MGKEEPGKEEPGKQEGIRRDRRVLLRYDIRKMQELLHSFYQLTQISIVVFNEDFQKLAEAPGHYCAFCELLRADKAADIKCRESDRFACEQCRKSDSLYSYVCHAGLTETVTPIRHGAIVIGYLMFGQVLQYEGTGDAEGEIYWDEIRKRCEGYRVDMGLLHSAYRKSRHVKMEQICAAARILEACSVYLSLERMISLREDGMPSQLDEFIDAHLDEDLSVSVLCNKFSVSRSKLYKIAHEYYGGGIEQIIRGLRVAKAKGLLETTGHPISEIAYQVGYSDYNYFIKVFKRETGVTPAKYRNKRFYVKAGTP